MFIYLPDKIYTDVSLYFANNGFKCRDDDGVLLQYCYTKEHACSTYYDTLPNLQIGVANSMITLIPQRYLLSDFNDATCAVMFSKSPIDEDYFIFGTTL